MTFKTLSAIALLAALCLPAVAEMDDSATINDAFAKGKASQERPANANEYWTCAAFWHVWADFAPQELGDAIMSKVDPVLSETAAREVSAEWEKQAALKMGLGMGELDAATELYIEQQTDTAWTMAEGVVWGDDYTFVAILGQCAAPPAR